MDHRPKTTLSEFDLRKAQELLSQILVETYTHTDALRRLRALKELLVQRLFSKSHDLTVSEPEDINWMYRLGENFYNQFNDQNVYQLCEYFEAQIKQKEALIIYIPFEMPYLEKVKMTALLRRSYGEEFLTEFKLDPQLIGGCALVWRGIYRDYSIKQKIKQNQEGILSTFRVYFKR